MTPSVHVSSPQTRRQTFARTTKHSIMSASPPPEEREKADAEARAKEHAEQAALPYKWDQTIKDLDITIVIDGKYKSKDLNINITRHALKATIKGQEPFIDVCLGLLHTTRTTF
jgi:hypothetical protein